MNAINGFLTVLFDLVLKPLEALGSEMALTIVSGVFGVLALVAFKYISWQKGIKATKDRIKGHMIEIRLYQDDLVLVSKAIGKVLLRNFQYLFLNFGPFIPLAIPFAFVVAQMVVRYAFDPVEVNRTPIEQLHAGEGTTIRIDLVGEFQDRAGELELVLPEGLEAVSPLVPVKGIVAQEFVARQAGEYDIVIRLGGEQYIKKFHAHHPDGESERPRSLQPERGTGFFNALLWPAEDTFPEGSGISRVSFVYPESDLGWLPSQGPGGVIIWFVIASMAFGVIMLKPLGVQI